MMNHQYHQLPREVTSSGRIMQTPPAMMPTTGNMALYGDGMGSYMPPPGYHMGGVPPPMGMPTMIPPPMGMPVGMPIAANLPPPPGGQRHPPHLPIPNLLPAQTFSEPLPPPPRQQHNRPPAAPQQVTRPSILFKLDSAGKIEEIPLHARTVSTPKASSESHVPGFPPFPPHHYGVLTPSGEGKALSSNASVASTGMAAQTATRERKCSSRERHVLFSSSNDGTLLVHKNFGASAEAVTKSHQAKQKDDEQKEEKKATPHDASKGLSEKASADVEQQHTTEEDSHQEGSSKQQVENTEPPPQMSDYRKELQVIVEARAGLVGSERYHYDNETLEKIHQIVLKYIPTAESTPSRTMRSDSPFIPNFLRTSEQASVGSNSSGAAPHRSGRLRNKPTPPHGEKPKIDSQTTTSTTAQPNKATPSARNPVVGNQSAEKPWTSMEVKRLQEGKETTTAKTTTVERSASAWVPKRKRDQVVESPSEKTKKDVRRLLNKVTPTTYGDLSKEFCELELHKNSEELIKELVELIFAKAVDEPHFCGLYADLCLRQQESEWKELSEEQKKNGETGRFRKAIVAKCQATFENKAPAGNKQQQREDEGTKEEGEDKVLEQADPSHSKRHLIGTIQLIAQLYQRSIIASQVMSYCAFHLYTLWLNCEDKVYAEIYIEYAVQMYETVGPKYHEEMAAFPDRVNDERYRGWGGVYDTIKEMKKDLTPRLRFLVMNLEDLERCNWNDERRKAKGPRTLEQLELEEQERLRKQAELRRLNFKKQPHQQMCRQPSVHSTYRQPNRPSSVHGVNASSFRVGPPSHAQHDRTFGGFSNAYTMPRRPQSSTRGPSPAHSVKSMDSGQQQRQNARYARAANASASVTGSCKQGPTTNLNEHDTGGLGRETSVFFKKNTASSQQKCAPPREQVEEQHWKRRPSPANAASGGNSRASAPPP